MKKAILLAMLGLLFLPIKSDARSGVYVLTEGELSQLYTCKEQVNTDTCLDIAQEDAVLLMKIARSEAGDNGVEAQLIVMNVIMNRLRDQKFPNNIHDIIYANKQFSVVTNGEFDKVEINVDSHLALARLEMGEDLSSGAIYFESASATDTWQSKHKQLLFEKYGQRFYR